MIREVLLLLSTRHCQRETVNWLEANRTFPKTSNYSFKKQLIRAQPANMINSIYFGVRRNITTGVQHQSCY